MHDISRRQARAIVYSQHLERLAEAMRTIESRGDLDAARKERGLAPLRRAYKRTLRELEAGS